MTQRELQEHPYWKMFQNRLSVVIDGAFQRGQLSPYEKTELINILRGSYNDMHAFVEGLIIRYQSRISDTEMDNEIYNWLRPAVQIAKQKVFAITQRAGMGPQFGGGGAFAGARMGSRSPFDSGASLLTGPGGTSPWGGGGGGFVQQPGQGPASPFDRGTPPEAPKPRFQQPKVPSPKTVVLWNEPKLIEDASLANTIELESGTTINAAKFGLTNDKTALMVVIKDPSVGYVSDREVIEKYKSVFDVLRQTDRKIMTIFYQQLKTIRAPREEIAKLIKALKFEVGKAIGLEQKLRKMIAAASQCNKRTYEAFSNLFLDELQTHMQSGELCDSAHPKNILKRINDLNDLIGLVTGEGINKDVLKALRGMTGFEDRLNELLNVLIEEFTTGLDKRILNPKVDMTTLDGFHRTLPGVWSEDFGATLNSTKNLLHMYMSSKVYVEGTLAASATRADSELRDKLDKLQEQFTLLFVPRVVTWCNYAKSEVCRYNERGECQPAVTSKRQPRNDVEFFLNQIMDLAQQSKDTLIKWAPRNVYMEIDEETFVLQYGRTTDGQSWIGTSKYWH